MEKSTNIGAYEVQDDGGREMIEELNVSTLEDENDGDFSAGDLSLREAIALANDQEGANTITFDESLNGGTIILSQGELNIEDSLTINSLGAENLTIDGNNNSRIFKIDDGNFETESEVTIDGVTIANGLVAEAPESNGGGILNTENLTISGSVITNNQTDSNEGANSAKGGGIYTTGTLNLIDSAVTGNTANTFGGGVYSLSTTVNLTNSTIDNNYSGFVGGGIYHTDSELNLTNSVVTGNGASFAFGGVTLRESTVNIVETTVSDNFAQYGSTGGISIGNSEVTITDSTISGNSSLRADGGGISVNSYSTVDINNSTIANNSAINNGGGINVGRSSAVNLSNATITGNSANNSGAGIYQSPESVVENPDGNLVISGGAVTLASTIVAKNVNDNDLSGAQIDSNGNNLIGNGDGVGLFNSAPGDLVGTADNPIDPRLGELQNNGGTTATIALLDGSLAIDGGSNPNNLATDQRGAGFPRVLDGDDDGTATADIGAFESINLIDDTSSSDGISGSDDNETTNFDEGNLMAGTIVTNQFEGFNIAVSSEYEFMVFDTARPTGEDYDLATDNLGNVLIISEDGDASDPDDRAAGGTINIEFDEPSTVKEIGLLDIEESGGFINLFDEVNLIGTINIEPVGDGRSFELDISNSGVARLELNLAGSGALTSLGFSPDDISTTVTQLTNTGWEQDGQLLDM